jgi:hypothetical protein
MADPKKEKGVGSSHQLNHNKNGNKTQLQSNSRQWLSPMIPKESQMSRAFSEAA